MTRIGSVTVRFRDIDRPIIHQPVIEDGENRVAVFAFEASLALDGMVLRPGAISFITHFRYRRAA